MSLRLQLLAFGLLTLVLPWAGYRYVQEMEGALRDGLERSLLASATTMARALDDPRLLESELPATGAIADIEHTIYAHPLVRAPRLDGYRDDWSLGVELARALGAQHRYWAGSLGRYVYLFLAVTDGDLVYQRAPGQTPYGDRIVLRLGSMSLPWLLLHTLAPGNVRSQHTTPPLFAPSATYEERVSGAWRETSDGFAMELRVPLDLVADTLGLAVIDVDPPIEDAYVVSVAASWDVSRAQAGAFVHRPGALREAAEHFEQPDRRLRIVNEAGWVMFDAGTLAPLERFVPAEPRTLSELLLTWILHRGDPPYPELERPPGYLTDPALRAALEGRESTTWYARDSDASAIVAAAVPIRAADGVHGAVVLEQGSDSILTLTNAALVRLMSFTLLASLAAAIGLLSYATILSFRIRRLARAADSALSPEGEIEARLPGRGARDEIGDLARSFADLLGRLGEYTAYLRTLKGKLAHELRTPLAVVSTSLDNLEREPGSAAHEPYLSRLRDGTERLDAILNAMSEATLMEQAITDAEPELFDAAAALAGAVAAYGDVYPERVFVWRCTARSTRVLGSGELIVQMLDKLVDNAVDFSPASSEIEVELSGSDEELCLSVKNRGSRLPQNMRSQLFDSLVSIRDAGQSGRHLGLGLYIVALVAKFHGGRVLAEDLPDGDGVAFRVFLPVAKA